MATNDLSMQLDLAAAQIITSVLVTLGATLFAISIGIQLTIPPVVRDVIDQVIVDQIVVADIQYNIVQQALDNYIVLLTAVGGVLIMAGIAYGTSKIRRIRKKLRSARNIESV
jgi:uncharacterized membrane protein YqgA involved in biofilm formation